MSLQSLIRSTGSYLPENCVTNADMEKHVDTSDEWIRTRTGIEQRHRVAEGELTSDMATKAAQIALDRAGWTASDVDLIVMGTTTADDIFPACATVVQAKLGCGPSCAFDVQAVCSGFVFALSTADAMLSKGLFKKALVIGADSMSKLMDWEDRTTCVLFGDGAGAMTLEAVETDAREGVLAHHIRTDGSKRDLLYVDGGVSSTGTVGFLRMAGQRVFKHAVQNISAAIEAVLDDTGLTIDDIDWFVPHQANKRILDGVAKKLNINEEKVIVTVDKHGNTSAASIPLALDTAITSGKIKPGDLILTEAMGGGFSWGASLFKL